MKGFAAFIMSGLPQAAVAVLGFALGSLVFPPLGIVCGAILALVTLRQGLNTAILLLSLLVIAAVVMGSVLGQPLTMGALYGLIQWLPVILLATLLRNTGSWQTVFQATLVVSLLGLLLAHLVSDNLEIFWLGLLQDHVGPLLEQAGVDSTRLRLDLPQLAKIMTGIVAVSLVLSTMLMLMLGRSMQASLYNPGGFADEFAELRIGLWPAGLAIVLMLVAMLLRLSLVDEALMIAMMLFFFQGLAVMHGLSRKLKWPSGMLVMLYVMLVLFFTPFALLLSVTGIIDALADMRRRIEQGS